MAPIVSLCLSYLVKFFFVGISLHALLPVELLSKLLELIKPEKKFTRKHVEISNLGIFLNRKTMNYLNTEMPKRF